MRIFLLILGLASAKFEYRHLQTGCYDYCKDTPEFSNDGSCPYCGTSRDGRIGYCCRIDGFKNSCSPRIGQMFQPQIRQRGAFSRHTCIHPSQISQTVSPMYEQTGSSGYSCAGDGQCLSNVVQPNENVLCSTNYRTLGEATIRCNEARNQGHRCDGFISYTFLNGNKRYELVNRVGSEQREACFQTTSFQRLKTIFTNVPNQSLGRDPNVSPKSTKSSSARRNFLTCVGSRCANDGSTLCNPAYSVREEAEDECRQRTQCKGIAFNSRSRDANGYVKWSLARRTTAPEPRCKENQQSRNFSFKAISSYKRERARNTQFSKYSCAGDGQCINQSVDLDQPNGNVLCSVNYFSLEDAKFRCNFAIQNYERCDGYISYRLQSGEIRYELVNQASGNVLHGECLETTSFQRSPPSFAVFSNETISPKRQG